MDLNKLEMVWDEILEQQYVPQVHATAALHARSRLDLQGSLLALGIAACKYLCDGRSSN